jgi:hypothetical protein
MLSLYQERVTDHCSGETGSAHAGGGNTPVWDNASTLFKEPSVSSIFVYKRLLEIKNPVSNSVLYVSAA